MNQPSNKENFLIEVTPEQLDTLTNLFKYVEETEGYEEIHYSPYWGKLTNTTEER